MIKKNWFFILFTGVYLLFCLRTYKNFGVTWDEIDVYNNGRSLYQYIFEARTELNKSFVFKKGGMDIDVLYSYLYPTVLYAFNKGFSMERYHLLNLSFAFLGFFSVYLILKKQYGGQKWPMLGVIVLFFIPRYTGDLAANPKDMPFAVMTLVSLALVYFSKNWNRSLRILVLGLMFGIAQSMRVLGLTILISYFLYSTYLVVLSKNRWRKKMELVFNLSLECILISMLSLLMMVVFWPYIGSNVLVNLRDILETSKAYPWSGLMLFNGKRILSTEVGTTYLPTWLAVTTPLSVLIFFGLSMISFYKRLNNNLYVLLIITFLINILMYFGLKPIIYDGLRHYLFVLPIMAMLAVIFVADVLRAKTIQPVIKLGIILVLVINIGVVAQNFFKLHPYEYIYFNELTNGVSGAKNKFENDYWGAAFRESVVWLKNNVSKEREWSISLCANPFQSYYYFPSNFHEAKPGEKADYGICYTRLGIFDGAYDKNTVFVVSRFGVPLNYVMKYR